MDGEILSALFSDAFAAREAKPAITFFRNGRIETQMSYFELEAYANWMATAFQALGVRKGDRVVLFIQKSLAFVIAHLAILRLGAISVPLNPAFGT